MSPRSRRGARTRAAHSPAAPPAAPTRERLIHAARKLLEDGGYAAASVQAIAERAGLAAGALYRHYPSKAELFVEVFRDAAKRDLAAMGDAAASGRCVERLEAVVATFARRALRHRRLAWALVYEPVDPLVDAERLIYRRNYREGMAALLRQGIAAGSIPKQDADLTAAAVVGVIAETLVGPLSPVSNDTHSEDDIVAAIVTLCRRVVGLPAKRR
jgi:AcrR family transcriptional regulator